MVHLSIDSSVLNGELIRVLCFPKEISLQMCDIVLSGIFHARNKNSGTEMHYTNSLRPN
jgi:hypothetical protein